MNLRKQVSYWSKKTLTNIKLAFSQFCAVENNIDFFLIFNIPVKLRQFPNWLMTCQGQKFQESNLVQNFGDIYMTSITISSENKLPLINNFEQIGI